MFVLIVAGCGDEPAERPDAAPVPPPPDAAVDATDAPPPDDGVTITVERFGTAPTLIAYRDGVTAAWQTPTTTATGYEIKVHGPYVLSSTCAGGNSISTSQVARTPDDARAIFVGCGLTTGPTVRVTGQMVQPGSVTIGGARQSSATPNWSFDLLVAPGTHEVIGLTADGIELRRDVAIAEATALTPAIDVAARGVALVDAPFAVSGALPDEELRQSNALQTTHAFALLEDPSFGELDKQKAVPTSLLRENEFHKLLISAFAFAPQGGAGTTRRVRRRWNPGQASSFALPDLLGPIAYAVTSGTLVATWSTVPEFFEIEGSVLAHTADFGVFWSINMTASKRFIDASSASITFDVAIPGYKPEWRIDYAKEHTRSVTTLTSRGATRDDRDESSASETANAGLLPVAPPAVDRRSP
jgi:hypothetical protein